MILKTWAKKQGINYRTALRWFHSGKMPVQAYQTDTGTIIVGSPDLVQGASLKGYAVYARVSSHDQKNDLARQVSRLRDFCAANGYKIEKEVSEIGSGLNGRRLKLINLLESNLNIVVEHPDRLSRFGVLYLQSALNQSGREIIVMNETESGMDLIQDFVDVVTSMCARIYGKRSAKNKAEKALKAVEE